MRPQAPDMEPTERCGNETVRNEGVRKRSGAETERGGSGEMARNASMGALVLHKKIGVILLRVCVSAHGSTPFHWSKENEIVLSCVFMFLSDFVVRY